MRILVCGGRDFNNLGLFNEAMLNIVHEYGLGHTIIEGNAKGADRIAGNFAENHGWGLEVYPADWDQYGSRAGYIRNAQMLREGKPDLVVAFPGGRGTKMMIELAEKAGVKVIKYEYKGEK